MKKTLLIMLFLVTTFFAFGESTDTSSANKAEQDSAKTAQNKENKQDGTNTNKPCPNCKAWCGEPVKDGDWLLVWAPVMLFIISVLAINARTKDFKLQDALTENEYPLITIANPEYTATSIAALPAGATPIPPTITVNKTDAGLPKSSSRYLAIITTSLTLIIASCLSSVYIFIYLSSGNQPEFNHLGDILLALGIGVTPYAFNKVSAAVSNKS